MAQENLLHKAVDEALIDSGYAGVRELAFLASTCHGLMKVSPHRQRCAMMITVPTTTELFRSPHPLLTPGTSSYPSRRFLGSRRSCGRMVSICSFKMIQSSALHGGHKAPGGSEQTRARVRGGRELLLVSRLSFLCKGWHECSA